MGSDVYYYCNSGYTRYGSSYSTCLSSGNWTGTKPTCQKSEYTIVGKVQNNLSKQTSSTAVAVSSFNFFLLLVQNNIMQVFKITFL